MTLARLVLPALLALTSACSSLTHRVETGVVIPAGGRAVCRLDLKAIGPAILDLDVESRGEHSLLIASTGEHGSSTSEIKGVGSFHFSDRWEPEDGVVTIAIKSQTVADVRCRLRSRAGVDLAWLVSVPESSAGVR